MLDRVMPTSTLLELVDELGRSRMIVGPVRRGDRFFYQQVDRAAVLDLGFNYCMYGPKAALLPAHEALFSFEKGRGTFTTKTVYQDAPMALVGVHPCDVNAIHLLDHVFANRHRDEHYLRRRANTFILGIDCPKPCTEGVFCRDMKANSATEGFDLMCYPLSADGEAKVDRYGVVFGTDTGRELVMSRRYGAAPGVNDKESFEAYLARKREAFPQTIPCDVDSLPGLLERSYHSLLWEATARRCYSCGSCNLSCPTCYCFNAYDEVDMTLSRGERMREWDGCHLRSFAEVAGGHNFRSKAASRLRHRIFRKGKWIKEREGLAGCVGCARCDRACTAKICSVEIYRQLAEEV